VRAAWQAGEAYGFEIINGPFSSEVNIAHDVAHDVVSDVIRAALANGATRVSLMVERGDPEGLVEPADDGWGDPG
jgi:hypothetical protein